MNSNSSPKTHSLAHHHIRKSHIHHKVSKQRIKFFRCQQQQQPVLQRQSLDDIPTQIIQDSVKFTSLRTRQGVAIVVQSVKDEAYALGIREGLQLLQVSDPIRSNEIWELNDRSSLKYIQDAIRMRRNEYITIQLSSEPHPLWSNGTTNDNGTCRIDGATEESDATSRDMDLLAAIVSEDEEGEIIPRERKIQSTIGENLMKKAQMKEEQLSALEKRLQRRKEYMSQASGRNDAPFFAFVFSLFFFPSLIILGVAAGTGYLDSLSSGWR